MRNDYPCSIVPDEPSGFFVQFVDREGAFTCGETLEEAIFNASEAV